MSIKMRTQLTHRFNRSIILPLVGQVSVNAEGEIEIQDENTALQLEEIGVGFLLVGGEKDKENEKLEEALKQKSEENELGKSEDSENDIGKPVTDPELLFMLETLKSKTFEELRTMAMPFTPKRDWKDLDQAGLVAFLGKKLTASVK